MPSISIRKIEEMKDVAYRPEEIRIPPEEAAYWVIRNPGRNLTIFPFYRLGGGEYPKTYGHFHKPPYAENYQVLYGKAGFLLQKMVPRKARGKGRIAEIRLKILGPGERFTVPAGFGHIMLNMGDDYVVTMDDHDPRHFDNDYGPVKEARGLGYFIVEDKGRWKAIPNSNFTDLPSLEQDV
ncbi:MAG: hypothetical protein BMS9Abin34_405 [Patescibacteria group bacterium]|nr:MAG: hypothetical protein BMS9Abin34_405 [Patescibacteria group bacterium]